MNLTLLLCSVVCLLRVARGWSTADLASLPASSCMAIEAEPVLTSCCLAAMGGGGFLHDALSFWEILRMLLAVESLLLCRAVVQSGNNSSTKKLCALCVAAPSTVAECCTRAAAVFTSSPAFFGVLCSLAADLARKSKGFAFV